MKLQKRDKQPAILLGNGLNNYLNLRYSWTHLLCELSKNKNTKEILDSKDITYPEYFDTLCFLDGEFDNKYKSLKPSIVDQIKNWKNTDKHNLIVDFAQKNNIPIITTNYDTTLLNKELIDCNKKITKRSKKNEYAPQKIEKKPFTDYYPWFSYYSNKKITDATKEFAIWQIHGFWFYKRSLSIGSIDYASNIYQMKRYIHNNKNSLYSCEYDKWIGRNSWLDIFLNNDLYIVGLSLDFQETSLRWLLMEREKYFRNYTERRKNTYYIYNSGCDSLGKGKEYFFNSIEIKPVPYDNYSEIYDKWEIV